MAPLIEHEAVLIWVVLPCGVLVTLGVCIWFQGLRWITDVCDGAKELRGKSLAHISGIVYALPTMPSFLKGAPTPSQYCPHPTAKFQRICLCAPPMRVKGGMEASIWEIVS